MSRALEEDIKVLSIHVRDGFILGIMDRLEILENKAGLVSEKELIERLEANELSKQAWQLAERLADRHGV